MMEQKAKHTEKVLQYLDVLCRQLGPRPVGSENNHKAADFIAGQFKTGNQKIVRQTFECINWKTNSVKLYYNQTKLEAFVSPFSPPCHLSLPGKVFDHPDKLAASNLKGCIAILHGALTKEPLMPRNFKFYNPEEHKQIVRAIEKASPEGIILVAHESVHPKPVIEDGDFTIPSVYMSQKEAKSLLRDEGGIVHLTIESKQNPSYGENIIVTLSPGQEKSVVLTAHLDTHRDSPGALDNASGVATLLLLAELIAGESFRFNVEFAFLNGEDHYNTPGEIVYLDSLSQEKKKRLLAINCDGVGFKSGKTGVSLMESTDRIATFFTRCRVDFPGIVQMQPWYQGDHMMFVQSGIPTMAITSTNIFDAVGTITHTNSDTPEMVDPDQIVELASFLRQLLHNLNNE